MIVRAVIFSVVLAMPAVAQAKWFNWSPGPLRLALEPGVSYLHEGGITTWSFKGGGISGAFNLTDRLALTGFFHGQQNDAHDPDLTIYDYGFGGRADIDVFWLTPFLELGFASVYWNATSEASYGPTLDIVLGAGVDVSFTRWLFGGIVFRYYAIGGTDVWSNPAYSTINARLGFIIGGR